VERGQVRQARGNLEFGAVAPLGGLHEGAPNGSGRGAAESSGVARERVPRPDGGRIKGRVADEPGVREALTGPGLAGLRLAAHVRVAGAGSAGDHSFEHLRHLVGLARGENALALVLAGLIDVSAGEDDLVNRGRIVM